MLKFLSGIAIIVFTTFCGYLFSKRYRQRKSFFTQLKEFNERFLNEIAYSRRPIRQFIASFEYKGEFALLLQEFCKRAEGGMLEMRSRLEETEYVFLQVEEKMILCDYFSMLGRGDSASQKEYFSALRETLSKLQKESEDKAKRYGDLYVKMGFLLGLFILILII